MSNTAKNPRKIQVFDRFPGASCLLKACRVAPWRLLSGLEGLKIAALIACWLQDGLEGAKMSPSWPKLAPRDQRSSRPGNLRNEEARGLTTPLDRWSGELTSIYLGHHMATHTCTEVDTGASPASPGSQFSSWEFLLGTGWRGASVVLAPARSTPGIRINCGKWHAGSHREAPQEEE